MMTIIISIVLGISDEHHNGALQDSGFAVGMAAMTSSMAGPIDGMADAAAEMYQSV